MKRVEMMRKIFAFIFSAVLFCGIFGASSQFACAQNMVHPIDEATERIELEEGTEEAIQWAETEWDKALNANYRYLMGELDKTGQTNLQTSQQEWIKYCDLEFKFAANFLEGIESPIYDIKLLRLKVIRQRALQLGLYLSNIETDAADAVAGGVATVKVSNAKQFLEALGSNRIIEMTGGDYNLSMAFGTEASLEAGVSWEYDEISLQGIKNLTIRAAGDGDINVVIYSRSAYVMNFLNCENITIEGPAKGKMTFGHTEDGECTGGVFGFKGSSHITIKNVGMYGSGVEGLMLSGVSDINVSNSSIYECNYDIMTVNGSRNVTFTDCKFYNNKEFDMVSVDESEGISFTDCEFSGNRGTGMFNIGGGSISVSNSVFSGNEFKDENGNIISVQDSPGVIFTNCLFD